LLFLFCGIVSSEYHFGQLNVSPDPGSHHLESTHMWDAQSWGKRMHLSGEQVLTDRLRFAPGKGQA